MRQRHSIRLHPHDYAQASAYYITLSTRQRAKLFGQIVDGQLTLSALGHIAAQEWQHTPFVRPELCLDAFVVMPEHVNAIVVIMQPADRTTARGFRSPAHTLGSIVRGFKATITRHANVMAETHGLSIWQRNYYEHIVRDEADLDRIRRYIATNAVRCKR